jgi:chemotaxis family two-component system response regulator Rcp1
VLIVEDNESDVFLIEQAVETSKLAITAHVVHDGEQAVQFFDKLDTDPSLPCPALVLLDINLPKKEGGYVLKHMRQSRRCAAALVVVVSSSDSPRDRQQMENLGADAYFRKPSEYDAFMKLGEVVKTLLTRRTE